MSRAISVETLTEEMMRRQLLEPSAPPVPASSHRPWFVSIVLGLSGWLAGGCVLGFIAMVMESPSIRELVISGLVLLAAAYGLYAVDRNSEFFDQLALALSVGGQLALLWATMDSMDSLAMTAACAVVIELAVLAAMPNDLARVLAAFFATLAWAFALRFGWWDDPHAQLRVQPTPLLLALVGWFVAWGPIVAVVHWLVARERTWMSTSWRRLARPALTGLIIGICFATWASEPHEAFDAWNEEGLTQSNWLALWPLLGAATALLAAFYAFRLRSRALVGVATAAALFHVSQFYFVLGATLLVKSWIMLGVGLIALLTAKWLRKLEAPGS